MGVLNLFPARVRFVNPDGTLTAEASRALAIVFERLGGTLGDSGFDLLPAPVPEQDECLLEQHGGAGEIEALRNRVADLEGMVAQLQAAASGDVYDPPSVDRVPFPVRWPTQNKRGDGSWADVWVPEQLTFVDNVLSLRNQSRKGDGSLYGLAAICMLDAAGDERGAFGYSRNSAIQPNGYTPDIVYVEYGDPFAGDGNPSSLKMICTMAAGSPYFPGTSFTCFENDAKTGETWVRSRGNKPINLEGTVLVGNAFTPSANGKLQVRENTNEFVIGVKNTASKEWVWGVLAGKMYFRNATDSVNCLHLTDNGRVIVGTSTDDGATKFQVNGGGIKHGSGTLLSTSVALDNGAGAAAGTLSNAPAAGNPTKWISINDNGTVRRIPAW